jgi:hypothetical protein
LEQIVFNKRVVHYLNNLVFILFNEHYFSFEADALAYKDFVLNEITLINLLRCKPSKAEHKNYGDFYIKIKANKHTVWYVFFDKIENTYYIEHIINNHLPEAQYFND